MAIDFTTTEVWTVHGLVTIYILVDRDTKFLPLRKFLETSTDNEPVVLPPRSSNCKAHLERMIFFGEGSLRDTLKEYAEHYCDEPY
ncbi:MAG: hypothetical protein NT013_03930 [Planctomycetia bacterium]|nr:hypothetical protein [Planctomycetia bacterium]